MPSGLGRQVGLLLLLWRDQDQLTQGHSHQCVYLLLQLLIQQKGEPWGGGRPPWWHAGRVSSPRLQVAGLLTQRPSAGSSSEFMHLNKMKNSEAQAHKDSELFCSLVKVRAGKGGGCWQLARGSCRAPHCPRAQGRPAHFTDRASGGPLQSVQGQVSKRPVPRALSREAPCLPLRTPPPPRSPNRDGSFRRRRICGLTDIFRTSLPSILSFWPPVVPH